VADGADDPPPSELVARLRAGDAAALSAAYQRHAGPVFRFLLRLCGRRELAEDLFQETWLRLARHARGLRPNTELGAWLYAVARNLVRSHARFVGVEVAALARWWYLGASAAAPGGAPDDAALAADTAARLARAVAGLPLAGREVLLLVAGEGLAVDEAARVLGITPEAARQRLHRARAELARHLPEKEP
jgi:RNA polymerase sigma-70 factor (ECF subfamily)